ncbi:hypothetical protein GX645_03775 [Candidatus Sumerlaeota bacterium]|nr:hypothetical protein [Candidatus Sumerlaeota bacterium]
MSLPASKREETLPESHYQSTTGQPTGIHILRVMSAATAYTVMLASIAGIIAFAIGLATCLIDPSILETPLNIWERIVRGAIDMHLPLLEQIDTTAESQAANSPEIVKQIAGIVVIASRPIGICLMVFIAATLAHLLVSVYGITARILAGMTSDEATTLRNILTELKQHNTNDKQ